MEQETELYLIKRIKELESQVAFYKGMAKITDDRGNIMCEDCVFKKEEKPIIEETTIGGGRKAFYEGHEISMQTIKKAKAFDKVQEIYGISVCCFPEDCKYEIFTYKPTLCEMLIDQETYLLLRGAIDG